MYTRARRMAGLISWLLLVSCCALGASLGNVAAIDALNKWWKQSSEVPAAQKAATITPAQTFSAKSGKVYSLPKHDQTTVIGFKTEGNIVVVLTNLTPAQTKEAQDLCHDVSGFVWANENRHFGLDDIKVLGARNDLLAFRVGLGSVH